MFCPAQAKMKASSIYHLKNKFARLSVYANMRSGARNKKFLKATVQAGAVTCSPHSLPRSNMQALSTVDSARAISVPQPSGTVSWHVWTMGKDTPGYQLKKQKVSIKMHILFTLIARELIETIVRAPSANCIKTKCSSKHLDNSYHMYLYEDALVRTDTHVVIETHTEYSDWQVTYGHARDCPLSWKSVRYLYSLTFTK